MVVSDYRLLPEAKAIDILKDITDLLRWLPTALPELATQEGLTVDLSRTLVVGESAGGWCAVQAGLLHGTGIAGSAGPDSPVKITAVISKFGWLVPTVRMRVSYPECPMSDASQYQPNPPLSMMGAPLMPADHVSKHLAAVTAGKLPAIVTGALLPARGDIAIAATQHGIIADLMSAAPELSCRDTLSLVKGTKALPAIWAFHGTADSIVHADNLRMFAERAREIYGDSVKLKETYVPDAEHGVGNGVHMKDGWVQEGLEWLRTSWP
jgi:acetyl esterase/lipase